MSIANVTCAAQRVCSERSLPDALDGALGLDRDRDADEPADQFGVALEQHERGNAERLRVGVDLDADHVEHADVADDRQADDDLRAEAELHVDRRDRPSVSPAIRRLAWPTA